MAKITNIGKRNIFTATGRICPGESGTATQDEIKALRDKGLPVQVASTPRKKAAAKKVAADVSET